MSTKHMQMKLNISKKVISNFHLDQLSGTSIWNLEPRYPHPLSLRFAVLKINRSR
jgi:hypothetical protein